MTAPAVHPAAGLRRRHLSALAYYAASIPALALGIRNPGVLWSLWRSPGRPRVLRLRGGPSFWVRSALEAWVVKETCIDRGYERAGTALRRGWHVVDVGAGIGDFAVLAARRTGGVVHAYEPATSSHELLRRNLELNGVAGVTAFAQAVGATGGACWLDTSGEPVLARSAAGTPAAATAGECVERIALADVIGRLPTGRCDFLKMDCEGAELETLMGAEPALLDAVNRLCLEYHDFRRAGEHRELAARLASLGRSVRLRPSPVWRETGLLYSEHPRVATAAAPATGPQTRS